MAGSIRPFVAGFEVTGDKEAKVIKIERFLLLNRKLRNQVAVPGDIEGTEVDAVPELVIVGASLRTGQTT